MDVTYKIYPHELNVSSHELHSAVGKQITETEKSDFLYNVTDLDTKIRLLWDQAKPAGYVLGGSEGFKGTAVFALYDVERKAVATIKEAFVSHGYSPPSSFLCNLFNGSSPLQVPLMSVTLAAKKEEESAQDPAEAA